MREIKKDIFLSELRKYIDCEIDYRLISDTNYQGLSSHKKAVILALKSLSKKDDMLYYYDIDKMKATKMDISFFNVDDSMKLYYYYFFNTPYGTPSRKKVLKNDREVIINEKYSLDDFNYLNKLLFPNGYDNLEICNWSTDFSNYFDDGLEWFGVMMVSIYDEKNKRFVIIGVSETD